MVLLAATLAFGTWVLALNTKLAVGSATGQSSLQLAGSKERANEVAAAWRQADVDDEARLLFAIDYPALAAYSSLLAATAAAVSTQLRRRTFVALAGCGVILGLGAWLAGLLDAIENALLFALLEQPTHGHALTVRGLVIARYALLAATIGYILIGAAIVFLKRLRPGRTRPSLPQ